MTQTHIIPQKIMSTHPPSPLLLTYSCRRRRLIRPEATATCRCQGRPATGGVASEDAGVPRKNGWFNQWQMWFHQLKSMILPADHVIFTMKQCWFSMIYCHQTWWGNDGTWWEDSWIWWIYQIKDTQPRPEMFLVGLSKNGWSQQTWQYNHGLKNCLYDFGSMLIMVIKNLAYINKCPWLLYTVLNRNGVS